MTQPIDPTPPVKDTPPKTQAEMTWSSNISGGFGWPLVMREASTTPANPAIRPCMLKMIVLSRGDRDTGKPGGLFVAANGQGIATKGGPLEQKSEYHEANQRNPDWRRDA